MDLSRQVKLHLNFWNYRRETIPRRRSVLARFLKLISREKILCCVCDTHQEFVLGAPSPRCVLVSPIAQFWMPWAACSSKGWVLLKDAYGGLWGVVIGCFDPKNVPVGVNFISTYFRIIQHIETHTSYKDTLAHTRPVSERHCRP